MELTNIFVSINRRPSSVPLRGAVHIAIIISRKFSQFVILIWGSLKWITLNNHKHLLYCGTINPGSPPIGPCSEFRGAGYARCFPQSVYSHLIWARDRDSKQISSVQREVAFIEEEKIAVFFSLQDFI